MSQERNKCIDAVKGIACIFVVFIHYPFPGEFGGFVKAIARFAVPFFFMTSGYCFRSSYLLRVKNNDSRNIKKVCILILFSTLYCEIFEIVRSKNLILSLQKQIEFTSIFRLILFNDTNDFVHLWYLWALLYCYIIFSYLEQHKNKKKIICFLPFLSFVGLILGGINKLSGTGEVYLFRNWLFIGIPFFSIGYMYHKEYSSLINKFQNKNVVLIISSILGFVLTVLENILYGNLEIYFGSIIVAASLFAFAIENPQMEISKYISVFGKKYSMWIYILHWGIMHVEYKLIDVFNLNSSRVYPWISPLILVLYTSICAMVANFILLRFKNIRKRK